VCYVPQSEMVPSSPARSPSLCISWAKSRPRLQADALGTLVVAGQRRPPCTRRSVGLSEGGSTGPLEPFQGIITHG
jgi:hypothetical protein